MSGLEPSEAIRFGDIGDSDAELLFLKAVAAVALVQRSERLMMDPNGLELAGFGTIVAVYFDEGETPADSFIHLFRPSTEE